VVIAVESVLAIIGDEDIGPAIVVEVADRHAKSPAVIGHAGLLRHVGKCPVVIVVKERGVGRGFLAIEGVECGAVDQIDVEPAVVVVIDQSHAGAVRFKDKGLLWPTHHMAPPAQARRFGHILKDHRPGFGKPTRSDRPSFSVVLGLVHAAVGHA
jgi:hypothetical protein